MITFIRTVLVCIVTGFISFSCSNNQESPYKNSAEEQKAKAEQAQKDLRRETSRY